MTCVRSATDDILGSSASALIVEFSLLVASLMVGIYNMRVAGLILGGGCP